MSPVSAITRLDFRMTDDQITEARAYINLGLSVLGSDLPAREARAQARRAAAEVLTEVRRLREIIDGAQQALHHALSG